MVPHWPAPWGLDADPIHQLIIDEELRRAGVRRPVNPIGIGWAGPTLLARRHRGAEGRATSAAMLAGEEIWCQLFSEPGAGSDLATWRPGRCATATSGWSTARRSGRRWPTSPPTASSSPAPNPDAPKHQGISYFICPMDAARHRDPADHRDDRRPHVQRGVPRPTCGCRRRTSSGEVDDGWALAKVTLGNERVSLSAGGALWGMGPTAEDLLDVVRDAGGATDPITCGSASPRSTSRPRSCGSSGCARSPRPSRARQPGPEASVRKILADEHGQQIMGLAKDLAGAGRDAQRRRPAGGTGRSAGTTASCSRRRSPSAAAPARCSATSSRSGCSACPTTSTSNRA